MSFVTGELETLICNAINIIVDKKIASANYDKMITAVITQKNIKGDTYTTTTNKGNSSIKTYKETCYKVHYQDADFIVYPMHEDKEYEVNDTVLVLIPNNDMRNVKYIMRKRPKE